MNESFVGPDFFYGLQDAELGTPELQLPPDLQEPVRAHLEDLRARYLADDWGHRVGFGKRPALVVVDLALFWTKPGSQMGSNMDPVVAATGRVLEAARAAQVPIFYSTSEFDSQELQELQNRKVKSPLVAGDEGLMEIDPRLERRPEEKLFTKRSASCFVGTSLMAMLNNLEVDTLIVTGVSTSHCVYATARDACAHFRVIIPREAVGERCQIMHMAFLLDMDLSIGDVMPTEEVVASIDSGTET